MVISMSTTAFAIDGSTPSATALPSQSTENGSSPESGFITGDDTAILLVIPEGANPEDYISQIPFDVGNSDVIIKEIPISSGDANGDVNSESSLNASAPYSTNSILYYDTTIPYGGTVYFGSPYTSDQYHTLQPNVTVTFSFTLGSRSNMLLGFEYSDKTQETWLDGMYTSTYVMLFVGDTTIRGSFYIKNKSAAPLPVTATMEY